MIWVSWAKFSVPDSLYRQGTHRESGGDKMGSLRTGMSPPLVCPLGSSALSGS